MSSSPAPPFPPLPAPDVRLLFGLILIGVLLNTMLYGVILIQVGAFTPIQPALIRSSRC
ncbi:hypothetical protein B0H17DRAFT_1198921 [Mycena rosella]|uniref:Uncharacterized protein n=1 Tax=Mycena rosella TaxID=1033263 RepID=A0AAD7DLQ1_MYCRO|nr:hypothetical protein B0H17DRAFT_1198921 [Mycena rosella]